MGGGEALRVWGASMFAHPESIKEGGYALPAKMMEGLGRRKGLTPLACSPAQLLPALPSPAVCSPSCLLPADCDAGI